VLIAVSGYGMQADLEKSLAAGIDHHLLKPVEPDLLYRLLEAYTARHR
jgi:CheY-like chemotaxis protein